MANEVLSVIKCPLPWCGKEGAELRQGKAPYIICEHCVSMIKSQSRAGKDGMRALGNKAAPPAPPKKDAAPPAAKPGEKKDAPPAAGGKSGGAGFF